MVVRVDGWYIPAGHPGHGLPHPPGPVDPGYGVEAPVHPDTGLPSLPGAPDQGLPPPPPGIWPPLNGNHPVQPLPGTPDQGLPAPPGSVWPPVPGGKGKFLVLAGIPGVGWRYVVVDLSLQVSPPIAGTPTPKG
jgi:hypothetical protein